jgi:hypothetical protein
MRKIFPAIPFLLMILMAVSSCKKNDGDDGGSSPEFFLRFKANGVQNEYKANTEGSFNKASGSNYISVVGATKIQFEATKSNMTIALTSIGIAVVNTTYTNYTSSTPGYVKGKLLQIAFYDENGKFYMSWGEEFLSLMPPGSVADSRVVITESTSAYIKGKFSGTLFTEGFTNKMIITDGEFYLRVI